MPVRDAHIKFPQEIAAHYEAARQVVPSIAGQYYPHLAQSVLQKSLIQALQPILQTETRNWKEIALLCKKYPTPSELNEKLNQLTFLDINCGSGMLLTALMRTWIQAKSELSLLFYPDGRRLSQIKMEVDGDELKCWDLRDNSLCEYYAPNPVRKVTYQHALTGKMTVVEEGKIKSEMQLLQEAIFEEKKRFVLTQIYGICGDILQLDLTQQAISLELAKHIYYTLESDYHDLVTLPKMTHNFFCANVLQSRFPIDMAWAVWGKKENDWENLRLLRKEYLETSETRKQKKLQKQIEAISKKICDTAIRHEERFLLLQKYRADFHQKYAQNTLFELEIAYQYAHLQAEIAKLENALGLQKHEILPLDWALTFPELADAQGIFRGASVVLSDIRPETLPDLPKSNQKFLWKNELYHRFCEQMLLKCLLPQGFVAMVLPASFLQKNDAKDIRKHLLQEMDWQEIGEISDKFVYSLAQNQANFSPEIAIIDALNKQKKHTIGKKYVSPQKGYIIETHIAIQQQDFLYQVEYDSILLQNSAKIVRGIAISQKNMIENEGIKLLKAKDISAFKLHFKQRYMPPDYPEFVTRQAEFSGENWVYVTHAQGKMMAAVSDSSFLFSKEVYGICLDKDISKYYVVAWLNAERYQKYIALKWAAVTTQNIQAILENSPLKKITTEKAVQIEQLVREMMEAQNEEEAFSEKRAALESLLSNYSL